MFLIFKQYANFIFSGDIRFDKESGLKVQFKLATIYLLLICLPILPISYIVDGWLVSKGVTTIFDQMTTSVFVLSGLIFAPLVEEIIFRSWLNNPAYIPAALVAAGTLLYPSLFYIFVVTALLFFIFFAFNKVVKKYSNDKYEFISVWMRDKTKILVWASCALFALPHATNYSSGFANYPAIWFPALLPQIALGFFFAYVRIRVGLIAAMGWHGLNNCVALLIMPIWPH